MMTFGDEKLEFNIEDTKIETTKSMKVLDIQFNNKMEWTEQVTKLISRTERTMHGLKLIR